MSRRVRRAQAWRLKELEAGEEVAGVAQALRLRRWRGCAALRAEGRLEQEVQEPQEERGAESRR